MTEKQRVTIIIEGPPAAGKSAIAQLLSQGLGDHGFSSEINEKFGEQSRDQAQLTSALNACAAKTFIEIIVRTKFPPRTLDDLVAVEKRLEQIGLPAVCDALRAAGYKVERDPGAALDAAVDQLARDRGLVVLIMPRDMGRHPDAPHGHSYVFGRADVVAEWRDGAFQVIKNKNGPTTRGERR